MKPFPFESSSESLLDVAPRSVEKFLRTTGWDLERSESNLLSIWRNADANTRIMLPLNPDFDDYRERLADTFAVLSRMYKVSGDSLAMEIASASSDIMFLKAGQYSSDGTIPLREAENLLFGARKMLTAAALAAVSPKANFGPARPAVVKDFIQDDVRMGHTLHGSFVITVLARLDDDASPKSGSETNDPLDKTDVPELSYQRRVMTTLATGLSVASQLLGPASAMDLGEAVEAGVSAQLIDSLGEITSFEGVQSLESTFRWSPGHAAVGPDIPTRIELPRATNEHVSSIKERLKRRPDPDFDQIIGQVVRLERGQGEDQGLAVVDGFVGKERKRVRVELPPTAYTRATAAHDEREPVVVQGAMTFTKGSYRIQSPTSFRTLQESS